MPTKTMIALSLAVVIGAASAAVAGPKDPLWPTATNAGAPTQETQVPTNAYASVATVSSQTASARIPAMWPHPH